MEPNQVDKTIGRVGLRPKKKKTSNKKKNNSNNKTTTTNLEKHNSEINNQPLASPSDQNDPNNFHNQLPPHQLDNQLIKDTHYKETGIKSKKIKYLIHPLDHLERNILIAFMLAIVFTFIALVSGLPTVLLLVMVSIPVLSIQHFIYFCANFLCGSKIYHKCEMFDLFLASNNNNYNNSQEITVTHENESPTNNSDYFNNSRNKQRNNLKNDWKYCPLDYLESYWFKPHLINQCILFTEQGLTLSELRKIIYERILLEPEFKKFKSRVVAKRFLFNSLFWESLPISDCQSYQDEDASKNNRNFNTSDTTTIRPMGNDISEAPSDGASTLNTHITKAPIHCTIPISSEPPKSFVKSPSTSSGSSYASKLSTSISIEDINSTTNFNRFSIEDHIIQDEPIESKKSLRKRNAHLLNVPFKLDKPLWQMRLAVATYTNQCVIIVRCHQSLADGSKLAAILVKCGLLNQQNSANTPNATNRIDSESIIPEDIKHNVEFDETNEMATTKDKLFKKRFVNSASNTINVLRACIVGPLTCFLWFIWAFSRRHYNHLNPIRSTHQEKSENNINRYKRFYMASYNYAKLLRIKQVTRSTVSEVILCALSGALREYLRRKCHVDRPPNLNIGLTVDMRRQMEFGNDHQNIRYVLVNVPLPIAVEGAIPRLWETRHIMEELRSSADPWVMLGFQYFLSILLPRSWYISLINFIVHRNSSICVSNMNQENIKMSNSTASSNNNGSDLTKLTIGAKSITKIYYCLQPPTKRIPISFNCISYNDSLFVSCSSKSIQIDDSKILVALFFRQLNQLSSTIAKKRIHGNSKLITQPVPTSSPEHHNPYQFRPNSIEISANEKAVCCSLHHDHFEDRQYDLFKLIISPMTHLTSSISADYIDKYSNLIGSCDCVNCRKQNLQTKVMTSSAASFFTSRHLNFAHGQYSETRSSPSRQLVHNLRTIPTRSTISLHGGPASKSTAQVICDRLNVSPLKADVNRRSKQHTVDMTSSLSHLEDLVSQRNMMPPSPTPTTTSRATCNSEGPVELVKRQFNQLMGDFKRRRSLAAITEHHGLQDVVVEQENDEIGDGNTQLRYPTNRRLSVIGLAVGPGRRASLVPFGSIAHAGIPKSYSSSNETQV